ncbi:hypothetical protein C8F04DRAFT_874714, partial [Mycena alexandri]
AKNRPAEVQYWVSRARIIPPQIANLDCFIKEFTAWWININPAWRKTSLPMEKKNGAWEHMDFPGPNGFLNVLMCLKWWRVAMDEESKEWKEAVEDVKWVL